MGVAKGQRLERAAKEFLERIFKEMGYRVVRSRLNASGTQDGFDVMLEVVDGAYRHYHIYSECKNYNSLLHYSRAIEKIPHLVSTHRKIDLLLFISPRVDFSNPNEDTKLEGFYDQLASGCPVEFLTPESRVREYFGLYPEVYLEVYGEQAPAVSEELRAELLDTFEKLVFSDKNLRKVVLGEDRRQEFIGKLERNPYHMPRNYRLDHYDDPYGRHDPDRNLELLEVLDQHIGVVVLGNPGYGKTHELRNLAVSLWEGRESGMVPRYRVLRDFGAASAILELLPEHYAYHGRLVLIFDGVDEVQQIGDFGNKLRMFIAEHTEMLESGALRLVISCRTSVYLKYIKEIEGLQPIYLNGVSEPAALVFLRDKFGVDVSAMADFDFWRFRDVLQNPYYLELVGKSFIVGKSLVLSRAKLMERYVAERLEGDYREKYRNDPGFDVQLLRTESRRLAMAMEVMQRAELGGAEISSLLEGSPLFYKNPFLEQNPSGSWSFEHKNVQEFLAAEVLSTFSFEEIIALVSIDPVVAKVHPGWHNVVAFLLNMEMAGGVQENLLSWLVDNDLELVFGADPEGMDASVRSDALQLLFERTCVQQTLWIEDRSTVARFGDVPESVAYLMERALDSELHPRARMSALSLLSRMTVADLGDQLEVLLLQLIGEFHENVDKLMLLGEGLQLCLLPGIKGGDRLLAIAIAGLTGDDHREIVRPLLKAIGPRTMALYLDFVLEILKKSIDELPWMNQSKYGSVTSTKELIFERFGQLADPGLLVDIFTFIMARIRNHRLREKHLEGFLVHLEKVFGKLDVAWRQALMEPLCVAMLSDSIFYMEARRFADMVMELDMEDHVAARILGDAGGNRHAAYFLSINGSRRLVAQVLEAYQGGTLKGAFVTELRDSLRYRDMELALLLEAEMERSTDFRFASLTDVGAWNDEQAFHSGRDQREFDIRFLPEQIVLQMERIYAYFGKEVLCKADLKDFGHKYHNDAGLQRGVTEYVKGLLDEILRKEYDEGAFLKIGELSMAVESFSLDRMEDILSNLPEAKKSYAKVTEAQRSLVHAWCQEHQAEGLAALSGPVPRRGERAWLVIRLLYGFQDYFRFADLDRELLMAMIWEGSENGKLELGYLKGAVSDPEIDAHLDGLLRDGSLTLEGYHLVLAYLHGRKRILDLKGLGIKQLMKHELSQGEDDFTHRTVELFFWEDTPFMEELVEAYGTLEQRRYLTAKLLDRLIVLDRRVFVLGFLEGNFDQLLDLKVFTYGELLGMMVRCDSLSAIDRVRQMVRQTPELFRAHFDRYSNPWKGFGNRDGIEGLLGLLGDYLSVADKKVFDRYGSPLRFAVDGLHSLGEVGGMAACRQVLDGLEGLDVTLVGRDDEAVFYVNQLRKDILKLVNVHQSRAFGMAEAMELLQRHRYRFLSIS